MEGCKNICVEVKAKRECSALKKGQVKGTVSRCCVVASLAKMNGCCGTARISSVDFTDRTHAMRVDMYL